MQLCYFVNIQTNPQWPSYTEAIWDTIDEAVDYIERNGYSKVSDNRWEKTDPLNGKVIRVADISTQLLP